METPYELPLWIIISAVVAGVLLLGIIILIMWKVRQLMKAHIEFSMCFLVLSEKVDTLVYNEIKTKICYFYMNALVPTSVETGFVQRHFVHLQSIYSSDIFSGPHDTCPAHSSVIYV